MKQTSKLLCLLLALVMVLPLVTTALAAETGSITVENPQPDQTYTAYKIFDVTYDKNADGTAGTHFSYTIDSGSAWYTTVNDYATNTANGLTLTQITGTTKYIVKTTAGFSAAAFANALKASTADKSGTTLTSGADNKPTASSLPLGYYFVTSTSGALCNLTTNKPNATIYDKNDVPFNKVDDKSDVEIGEKVTYTITGEVPDTAGFENFTYKITDVMSTGLTFNKNDLTVKIGTDDVTTACTIEDKKNTENEVVGFTLTIPVKNYQDKVKSTITVTYTATVNEKAIATIEHNQATLTYSNGPLTEVTTEPDIETVYSCKLVIDKYENKPADSNDHSTKLAGAKFVLMNREKNKYYYYDTVNNKVCWNALTGGESLETALAAGASAQTKITEVTTSATGAAEFKGLKNGIYYLVETAAPAGYNKLTEEVEINQIDGSSATEENLTPLTFTQPVANETGVELPTTGGIGTTLFYIFGGILVVGAGVLLVTKKRMSAE